MTQLETELLEALEDLLENIPKQTNDADWWDDGLTNAVRNANDVINKAIIIKTIS